MYGSTRGTVLNRAASQVQEANVRASTVGQVLTSAVAVVEHYDNRRGMVNVKLKMEPDAPTFYNVPVMWGDHEWPLKKGAIGFLHFTHVDSAGATLTRERRHPDFPGRHRRSTAWFDPREPRILSEERDARWRATSGVTDRSTYGPNDSVWRMPNGSAIIEKSNGDLSILPATGRKVYIENVDLTIEGETFVPFWQRSQAVSVGYNVEAVVLSYTAPEVAFLDEIVMNGTAAGEFRIYFNGVRKETYRVEISEPTQRCPLHGYKVGVGDVIEVRVVNHDSTAMHDYESTLRGRV